MTLQEMIKSFESLSEDEQDLLLEIFHKYRNQTREKETKALEKEFELWETASDEDWLSIESRLAIEEL
ncbi:MAG: hypothetical protein QNJ37_12180 [Crocosphaera sp.]|nr:hypothetical protein [Crocosphaera sp.]